MELKSLSHTHTQLLVDALTTLGLLRCYGLEFGSPKLGTLPLEHQGTMVTRHSGSGCVTKTLNCTSCSHYRRQFRLSDAISLLIPRRSSRLHHHSHTQARCVATSELEVHREPPMLGRRWGHLPEEALHFCWVTSVVFSGAFL
ncbi:hypothetical protein ACOMHN_019677 [Nucella lapillus]